VEFVKVEVAGGTGGTGGLLDIPGIGEGFADEATLDGEFTDEEDGFAVEVGEPG
jgi:hypothetical protein